MNSTPTLTLSAPEANLPPALSPLAELAYNLYWSWRPAVRDLFARIDPDEWEAGGHNPVRVLAHASPQRLAALAGDPEFVAEAARAAEDLRRELAGPCWFDNARKDIGNPGTPLLAAYFCAEFGLTECFQIYSGGLGLLAGDHLKSASQLGLPLIGVGLLYRNGYFHQHLDADGMQQENFPPLGAPRQPVRRVLDASTREQITVGVHLPGRELRCAVWRCDVGRVRLYLLDTNIEANSPEDREITANLYLGDQNRRILQELVLGIGGVRALAACREHATVFHMNEGHAAFLALERIRAVRQHHAHLNITFDQAREAAAAGHVFTTHTPVPAGIDRFPPGLVSHYFEHYVSSLGLDMEGLMALGREDVANRNEAFSMAVLALRCSRWANGVSRLHGQVSRRMWREIWPETPEGDVPIGHVTNGIHTDSWVSPHNVPLFDRAMGRAWREAAGEPASWNGAGSIADADLWAARNAARRDLLTFVNQRAAAGRTGGIAPALDPEALTIGFARRFAGYKRATLLFRDETRLKKLLDGAGGRPVQFVFSGKAHPGDTWGKHLIRDIVHFARSLDGKARGRIVFLDDYAIDVARQLVQGCDVWLNNPIRGLEASGTSGMKAALNGVLNCSILDGWWDEGFDGSLGFRIPERGTYPSDAPDEEREAFEAEALYRTIESEVVPAFYQRDSARLPRKWLAMMKACIARLGPEFSTHRMVAEYARKYYFPAHDAAARLAGDEPASDIRPARDLADHIDRYRKLWPQVRVRGIDCAPTPAGDALQVGAVVRLGQLRPDEVRIEVYHGPVERATGRIEHGHAAPMVCKHPVGDGTYQFAVSVPAPEGLAAAHHGLLVRILPGDPLLVTPFVPGLICNSPIVAAEPGPGGHL
ncbi:MAG: alpha-glucan family phosphorylase [Phycisphaeraceae bacterium]|nr:alpha-glucan family phosphorylase [Phycisphaeraceae bacterium]